jgi:hypothetical protein
MWDQNTIKAGIGKKSPNVKRSELRRKLKEKKNKRKPANT